jgi:predicted Holliday junction resolvase-like endonuclease|tara:strand:- start:1225 stop:1710 length:486 start_codon:yes stop_codon:yes gene_type:complete
MQSNISLLITNLLNSKIFAICPNCRDEFKLSEATLFDGTKSFPESAEIIRKQLQQDLDEQIESLEKRKIVADEGAEKKAIAIGIGKIIEKVLPAYKKFNMPLADCSFLAEPIDMVVFEGACENSINRITFLEIKTGDSSLNKHQRQVRDAVKDQRVISEVI